MQKGLLGSKSELATFRVTWVTQPWSHVFLTPRVPWLCTEPPPLQVTEHNKTLSCVTPRISIGARREATSSHGKLEQNQRRSRRSRPLIRLAARALSPAIIVVPACVSSSYECLMCKSDEPQRTIISGTLRVGSMRS